MSLTAKEVERIAHLARLEIHESERSGYAKNLSDLLALAAKMNEVNTDGIEPMAHPINISQRVREDVVTEINQRELFQSIAPMTEAGLYLVPEVMEEA